MPAILDDPASGTIYRVSGSQPFPDPSQPSLPPSITLRHVTLRDRQTVATVVPFASRAQVPESLLRYLSDQFNKEIEGGDTYPMLEGMPFEAFSKYWFQNFAGIMLLGHIESADQLGDGKDWSKECLGTFYIKPNYPGRSSHICNAGFIVTDASRNRGVGRLMGESYLDWAPKLGYNYSVFNLVYETNVASCKIWDALGFKRIGRVKGAGNLKSFPDRLIDAIIYGRDLGDGSDAAGSGELVSEERFDKIKFYLKTGRYPNGADRAEKSRLRSAAIHYKLLEDGDVLMLRDKEVISDTNRQYEISKRTHVQGQHAGINKTTATVAEKYHWSRIKETVSDVIRNCSECKELGKNNTASAATVGVSVVPTLKRTRSENSSRKSGSPSPGTTPGHGGSNTATDLPHHNQQLSTTTSTPPGFTMSDHYTHHHPDLNLLDASAHHDLPLSHQSSQTEDAFRNTWADDQPIDPQIISSHHHSHPSLDHPSHHHSPYTFEEQAFHALLAANSQSQDSPHHHELGISTHDHIVHGTGDDGSSKLQDGGDIRDLEGQDTVDRDLEMLLSQSDDDGGVEKYSQTGEESMAGMDVDGDSRHGIADEGGGHGRMDMGELLRGEEEVKL